MPGAGLEPASSFGAKDFKSFAYTKFRHPGNFDKARMGVVMASPDLAKLETHK